MLPSHLDVVKCSILALSSLSMKTIDMNSHLVSLTPPTDH